MDTVLDSLAAMRVLEGLLVKFSGSEIFDAFVSKGAQTSLLQFLMMELFVKLFCGSIPLDH